MKSKPVQSHLSRNRFLDKLFLRIRPCYPFVVYLVMGIPAKNWFVHLSPRLHRTKLCIKRNYVAAHISTEQNFVKRFKFRYTSNVKNTDENLT